MSKIRTYVYSRKYESGKKVWMVRWKSPTDRRWRATVGGVTKDEALLREGEIRKSLYLGKDPASGLPGLDVQIRVHEVIDRFYKHSRFLSGTNGWRFESRSRIERELRPPLGNFAFHELTKDRLYKTYLGMRDRGLRRASIHKAHTLLCLLCDLFQEVTGSPLNPARNLKDFNQYFPKKAPDREIHALTLEELSALLTEIQNSKSALLHAFVKILAFTGMRRGEAYNLKWTDIDEGLGVIHIRQSKSGKARTIPLEAEAADALRSLARDRVYVFSLSSSKRPRPESFLRPLKRAVKRLGIKKRIDLHTFRHSYATNKIRAGWGIKKVSMLLGHADISMTSKVYTHLLDGDLKVRDDVLNHDSNVLLKAITSAMAQSEEAKAKIQDLLLNLIDLPKQKD